MKKPAGPEIKKNSTAVSGWNKVALCFVLVALIFIAYRSTLSSDSFLLNWDDQLYIYQNKLVTSPLTLHSVWTMFTRPVVGTYCGIPQLTWWADYHLYNIQKLHVPGTPLNSQLQYSGAGFHLTNLLFHTANTVLVFLIFLVICQRLKYPARSSLLMAFTTAFLFGLHPQHVESVAWATERKDLTYALFFLLALYSYVRISHNLWRIVATTFFFILSLLSKGQAVALVPTLFLVDYVLGVKRNWKLYSGFLGLAIAAGLTAIKGQGGSLHFSIINNEPLMNLFFIVPYTICSYLSGFVLPINLSAFYPYPDGWLDEIIEPQLYIFLILCIAAAIFLWYKRRNRQLIFAFFFFLVNIALLLQVIPVGGSVMADRYMYIASLGPAFLVALIVNRTWNYSHKASLLFCIPALLLVYATDQRCGVWKNDILLWHDTLAKKSDNVKAFELLAAVYDAEYMEKDSAYIYARKAIDGTSLNSHMYVLRAGECLEQHLYDSAVNYCQIFFNTGLACIDSMDSFELVEYRGIAYCHLGRDSEAVLNLQTCLQHALPSDSKADALASLGSSYAKLGQLDSAIAVYNRLFVIRPRSYTQFDIVGYYLRKGDIASAQEHFKMAVKCPDAASLNKKALNNMAMHLSLPPVFQESP